MRVLVCGGRDYTNYLAVNDVLNRYLGKVKLIISGGAPGADTMAKQWAESHGIPCSVFRADWKRHGRAAGPLRNLEMIDKGLPDLVIAFPGKRGTADMVRRARKFHVKVIEIN